MYRIFEQDDALFIAESADVRNAIRIENLSALLRLRSRIEQYLFDQKADDAADDDIGALPLTGKYIDTPEARRMAHEDGIELASSTLITACAAGNIDGAEKRGARWWMPADSFYRWLHRRDRSK